MKLRWEVSGKKPMVSRLLFNRLGLWSARFARKLIGN